MEANPVSRWSVPAANTSGAISRPSSSIDISIHAGRNRAQVKKVVPSSNLMSRIDDRLL
jgi:hypothetical protein